MMEYEINELDEFVTDLTMLIKITATHSRLDVVEQRASESGLVKEITYERRYKDYQLIEELILCKRQIFLRIS